MKKFYFKKIAVILVMVLAFNLIIPGILGNSRVKAGFLDDNQGSILTIVKGLVMLWVINLMMKNSSSDGKEDLITSTIKKGLNLDQSSDISNSTNPADDSIDKSANNSSGQIVVEENSPNKELTALENNLVKLVNEKREEKGLNSLNVDLRLVEVARKKARDMIENNYFDHQSPTYGTPFAMIKAAGIKYSLAGENLAGSQTVEKAFSSLMASPEHRDNILNSRYDKIGVAVIKGGPYGLMIVQLFIDSPDPTK